MNDKTVTKQDLVDLHNNLTEEADHVKGFRSVGAGREKIIEVLGTYDAEELAALTEAQIASLEAAGISLEEAADEEELEKDVPPMKGGKEKKAKKEKKEKEEAGPRVFKGQERADPRVVAWYVEAQPKRGDFGNHCHERVYVAMEIIGPATKEVIAAAAGTSTAVVGNAIHDFRNKSRDNLYHTRDGKTNAVPTRRVEGATLYALDASLFPAEEAKPAKEEKKAKKESAE